MTTYTASTNVEKIRKSKPSLFDSIIENRSRETFQSKKQDRRLQRRFKRENELN